MTLALRNPLIIYNEFTCDGLISKLYPAKPILSRNAGTQPRSHIILHEMLFFKDTMHLFAVYKRSHDKSDN